MSGAHRRPEVCARLNRPARDVGCSDRSLHARASTARRPHPRTARRPAQRCLHVFEPSSRCSPPPRRAPAAPLRRCDDPGARCSWAVRRVVARAVRGLALTSLADSAAHRGVASADRGAREPTCSARRADRRDRGAFERLGAGARAARRPASSTPSSASRSACRASSPSLSPRSLLALEPRFEQLLIDGASLDVRRDKRGRIRVAGLDFGGKDSGRRRRRRCRRLVLQAARVRDPRRHAALDRRAARTRRRWRSADVELVVRNGLREHDVRIDATPPPGWGDRFSVRGRFTQPLFSRAERLAPLERQRVRRAAARRRARAAPPRHLPFELSEGDGALRGWFERAGRPGRGGASLDVALRAVALRLDKSVEPLEFEQVAGRIDADAERRPHRASQCAQLRLSSPATACAGRKGDLRVAWRQDEAGDVDRRRVRRRAARRRRDGRDREPRADRRRAARAARRRPPARRDHPAAHALGRAARCAGALPGQGPAERPVARRPRRRPSADAARPARPRATPTVQLEASETGGQARIGLRAGVARPARRVRRARAAARPARRQAGWKIEPRRERRVPPKLTVKVRVGDASPTPMPKAS